MPNASLSRNVKSWTGGVLLGAPTFVVEAIPKERTGEAIGVQQVVKQAGQAIGIQVAAVLVGRQMVGDPSRGPGRTRPDPRRPQLRRSPGRAGRGDHRVRSILRVAPASQRGACRL